jgi:hypothetical protein
VLEETSFSNVANAEQFRADLINIAKTTLSSKILTVVSKAVPDPRSLQRLDHLD